MTGGRRATVQTVTASAGGSRFAGSEISDAVAQVNASIAERGSTDVDDLLGEGGDDDE